jgi:hypothetical protein
METDGSIPWSQETATDPYPDSDESTQHILFKVHFNIIL